jgi:dTDP-glucose 4,6-dehydratase
MKKRILITGVTGFIGRALAEKLRANGYDVIGLSLDNRDIGFDYFNIDVVDSSALKKVTKKVDAVVHLAAPTSHKEITDNPDIALKTNLIGTYNMLGFFESSTAKTFIYASTGKVYGRITQLPCKEEHPLDPQNMLGKFKRITEELIRAFACGSQKNFVILRIFNVYGPGQKEGFVIPDILSKIGKKIVLGDINSKRDYLYIDDLLDAFIAVIKADTEGLQVFNVGTSKSYSAKELVKILSKLTGKKLEIEIDKSRLRKDEFRDEYADISKLKALGWYPKIGIEEGLKCTLQKFTPKKLYASCNISRRPW